MRVGELAKEVSGAATEGGKDFAGVAVEHIDLFVVFINDVDPFLSRVPRKRQHGC